MLKCLVWNTPATEPRESTGNSAYFDSPRAGGKYRICGGSEPVCEPSAPRSPRRGPPPEGKESTSRRGAPLESQEGRSAPEPWMVCADVSSMRRLSVPAPRSSPRLARAAGASLFARALWMFAPQLPIKRDELDSARKGKRRRLPLVARGSCCAGIRCAFETNITGKTSSLLGTVRDEAPLAPEAQSASCRRQN